MQNVHHVINQEKKKIAAFAVAFAAAAACAIPLSATTNAAPLDKLDLSISGSSQDDDGDRRGGALRLASTDQLENLGLGLTGYDASNGNTSNGILKLETTDYLENVSALSDVKTVDEDGSTAQNTTKVATTDYLENVAGSNHTYTKDEDGNSSEATIAGHSNDYGQDTGLEATSTTVDDGDVTNTGIRFGFED